MQHSDSVDTEDRGLNERVQSEAHVVTSQANSDSADVAYGG